jgi:uncharacterized glyoxalase superfamily protein PhnB
MRTNRSMPRASVIPVLPYPDVAAAADWLERAFGFRRRLVIADHRIQMQIGDGAVALVRGERGAVFGSVMVRVEDARAHYAHAVACGAQVTGEPVAYPYGEKQYSATDPWGQCWTFSETIEDVDPADWGGVLLG